MKNPNLNFFLYSLAYRLKTFFSRLIPHSLVRRNKNLSGCFDIGITTYIDRYDDYFKPLYHKLKQYFPDVRIIVAVNGFTDKEEQSMYLSRLNQELCSHQVKNSVFILHDNPVGLTRLWNEILSQSLCENTLILNDDLDLYPWFRRWIENVQLSPFYITLLEGTWSHFLISKRCITEVGWFDEGFKGIGFEDMDYTARCNELNKEIRNIRCPLISHKDHKPKRTSYGNNSGTVWGPKYSSINHEYFFTKWAVSGNESGFYVKQLNQYVKRIISDDRRPYTPLKFINDNIYYPDRLSQT